MPLACRIPKCPLTQTGVCLEGFEEVSKCPNYGESGTGGEAPQAGGGAPQVVQLPLAKAMTPEATYEVTRASFARLIVCAGEQRSGKTTLLASIYEAFQEGPLGTLAFAGSRSLHGFERRSHLSRLVSGLDHADTDRTKAREGFQFLHLRVWDTATGKQTDLLFGDMSGELYKGLRNSSDECRKYAFLGNAHDFVVLLDGGKVAAGEHAEAFAHTSALVRALLDSDVLGSHSRVTLLTTKCDLLSLPLKKAELDRIDSYERLFRGTFGARLREIACARSAARPDEGVPMGIEPLLRTWLQTPELLARSTAAPSQIPAVRCFDTYGAIRRRTSPWGGEW
jgi:hypothetical protein